MIRLWDNWNALASFIVTTLIPLLLLSPFFPNHNLSLQVFWFTSWQINFWFTRMSVINMHLLHLLKKNINKSIWRFWSQLTLQCKILFIGRLPYFFVHALFKSKSSTHWIISHALKVHHSFFKKIKINKPLRLLEEKKTIDNH